MTIEESATVGVATESAALPPVNEQTAEADKSAATASPDEPAKAEEAHLDKEAADASEAAKKLNERKQRAKERIDQLTRQKHDAERESARLRERLALYENSKQPDPSQFTDQTAYDLENTKFAMSQVRRQELTLEAEDAQKRAVATAAEAFSERAETFRIDVPEYNPDALANIIRDAPNAGAMALEVLESEFGPALDHHLSQNPREALRIASLPQRLMVRELARIEARLSEPPQRRITQAPAPVKPVVGSASRSSEPDPAQMGMSDYAAWRKRQGQ